MTDQRSEELRFYEDEWLKLAKLHQTEKIRALDLADQLEQQRALNLQLREHITQLTQVLETDQTTLDLRTQLESARYSLRGLERIAVLESELETERKRLLRLQRRCARPDFWRELAHEFAESLDAFPSIYGSDDAESDDQLRATVGDWHAQIQVTLERVLAGESQMTEVEYARKILMAQWVLLRWFEVSEVVQ